MSIKRMSKEERTIQDALGIKPKVEYASADWKDTEGMAESFIEALKTFGVHVYPSPSFEGSDTFGYILSDRPLTKKQINKIDEDTFDRDEEEDQ